MEVPAGPCPVCGGYSLIHYQQMSSLLAVCDVLVFKALEALGKRLVRQNRSRAYVLPPGRLHEAHTIWETDDEIVSKALVGAWAVVPALLDVYGDREQSKRVQEMLDSYVHDLAVTGTAHSLRELLNRFNNQLGLPVFLEVRDERGAEATSGAGCS